MYIAARHPRESRRWTLRFHGPGAFGRSDGRTQGSYATRALAQGRADDLNACLSRPEPAPDLLAAGYVVRLISPRGESRWWLRYSGGDENPERYARPFAAVYNSEAAARAAASRWLGWSDGGAFWNCERESAARAKREWAGWSYAIEYQDAASLAA